MATPACTRSLFRSAKPFRRKTQCPCFASAPQNETKLSFRRFSTGPARSYDGVINRADRPRWSHVPEAARAPVSLHAKKDPRFVWKTNEDPELLNRVYVRILGEGGDRLLTEEVKWLAVTHKSFDQGRRGYNDRLAVLGRRIVVLQASLNLIMSPAARERAPKPAPDPHGRTPFAHPALEGLETLTSQSVLETLDRSRLGPLAVKYGLTRVLRWLPKKPDNLQGSGIDTVLTEALYAIVGAIALQGGGEKAAKIARDRILAPLGVV
ncbi:MAG: hypothetical protein M1823_000797 [Watsoniomyces obsoletus]|nr:MAG: hypothetical protein M1823_000797 [Watsoniomyces obsoletus]